MEVRNDINTGNPSHNSPYLLPDRIRIRTTTLTPPLHHPSVLTSARADVSAAGLELH